MDDPDHDLSRNGCIIANVDTESEGESDEDNSYRYGCYDARSATVALCEGGQQTYEGNYTLFCGWHVRLCPLANVHTKQ